MKITFQTVYSNKNFTERINQNQRRISFKSASELTLEEQFEKAQRLAQEGRYEKGAAAVEKFTTAKDIYGGVMDKVVIGMQSIPPSKEETWSEMIKGIATEIQGDAPNKELDITRVIDEAFKRTQGGSRNGERALKEAGIGYAASALSSFANAFPEITEPEAVQEAAETADREVRNAFKVLDVMDTPHSFEDYLRVFKDAFRV